MPFSQTNSTVLRKEMRSLLLLAVPVALAELGWMFMSVVDTAMVGRLNAVAIGAVGLGGILYYTIVLFGFGILLSMDPLIARSYGAGDIKDCHHTLHQGIFLALALTLPLMALTYALPEILLHWNLNRIVVLAATPFIRVISWCTLPLLLYACLRRYLQAMHRVQSIMIALLTANLVNFVGDWALIYGHLGLRAHGIVGAAWATLFSRIYLMGFLVFDIIFYERKIRGGLFQQPPRLDWQRIGQMLRLGFPAATQIILEMGAFAAATVIAGKLAPAALAAHQIALNCATLTYGIPLGIGSATAVSVGHALGRKDPHSAIRVGWLGIALGAVFMSLTALMFLLFPGQIMRLYTTDASVIAIGSTLIGIAAFFQLFDGIQTVTTGALRGISDTHSAMLLNLICYWALGLPLGYVLCFHFHFGVAGVWSGLSLSLVLLAASLLVVWRQRTQSLSVATIAAAKEFTPPAEDVPMAW